MSSATNGPHNSTTCLCGCLHIEPFLTEDLAHDAIVTQPDPQPISREFLERLRSAKSVESESLADWYTEDE